LAVFISAIRTGMVLRHSQSGRLAMRRMLMTNGFSDEDQSNINSTDKKI